MKKIIFCWLEDKERNIRKIRAEKKLICIDDERKQKLWLRYLTITTTKLFLQFFVPEIYPFVDVAAHPHPHLVVDNLEQFVRLRNSSGLDLAPYWHIVHRNLECSRGDELSFQGVAEKESHHARVQLVLHHPRPPARGHGAKLLERIERHEHSDDDHHLQHADSLWGLKPVPPRREVIARNGEVWVFLLQYTCVLLKYPLVTSRVTVEELNAGAHQVLGELGLGDVLLGICPVVAHQVTGCHGSEHQEQPDPYRSAFRHAKAG